MEYNDLQGLIKTLPASGIIWKYTSFERAIDLFQNASLYFRRLDKYPSKDYEGHFGRYEYDWLLRFMTDIRMKTDYFHEAETKAFIDDVRNDKARFFISCWMYNNNANFESRRHWEAYGNSNSENCGLLLKTSVSRYMKALSEFDLEGSFSQALVNYLNWSRLNLSIVFNSKPREFKWEDEARFSISLNKEVDINHLRVSVSLPDFIEEVRFPPNLKLKKRIELERILGDVGLENTLKQSLMRWN